MAERTLKAFLYLTAAILLLALPCAFLPYEWMNAVHGWLGMGTLADEAMVLYLARSASLLYAAVGTVYAFVAQDVHRYRDLLVFLGWLEIVFGLILIPIDLGARMPWFWTLFEGPFVICWGFLLLYLVRRLLPRA